MNCYTVLDCNSLSQCPPSVQHLVLRNFCSQHDAEVSFYTCEDPLSLPYGVFKSQLPDIATDAFCFFTTKQLVNDGFDFSFLEQLLERGSVGFARENIWVTKSTYPDLRPWLWREGLEEK